MPCLRVGLVGCGTMGEHYARVLDPKGQGTSYAYDPLSRLISVTQPGSVVTSV